MFPGKPIIPGRRLALEHVPGKPAGDRAETIQEGHPWLEARDFEACLIDAHRPVGDERIEALLLEDVP
jgi:uncharacterized protein (DUF433 family)